jgi:GST-like protein
MAPMIELYYWPTPNGWKISIMLEELGVPYEVKYINIGKGEQFAPDFLKIDHRSGRSRRSADIGL